MTKGGDHFDRIARLPVLRVFEPFYWHHKQMLLYLLFGALTFLVSMGSYALFTRWMGLDELRANVPSWFIAVLFAFLTNRSMVFSAHSGSKTEFFRQMASFYASRALTLLMEELLLLIFVTWLAFPDMAVKFAAQILVVTLNYVISKRVVFRS